jgi:hypothetical protein
MQGMEYEDVRARVKRLNTPGGNTQLKANLKESLINQARLREGEGAAREIHKELNYTKKYY